MLPPYILVKNPNFSSLNTEMQTEQKELTTETSGLCAVLVDASPFGVGEIIETLLLWSVEIKWNRYEMAREAQTLNQQKMLNLCHLLKVCKLALCKHWILWISLDAWGINFINSLHITHDNTIFSYNMDELCSVTVYILFLLMQGAWKYCRWLPSDLTALITCFSF